MELVVRNDVASGIFFVCKNLNNTKTDGQMVLYL